MASKRGLDADHTQRASKHRRKDPPQSGAEINAASNTEVITKTEHSITGSSEHGQLPNNVRGELARFHAQQRAVKRCLEQLEGLSIGLNQHQSIKALKSRLKKSSGLAVDDLRVVVFGQQTRGVSTLINTLLGDEILTTAPPWIPVSLVPTFIHNWTRDARSVSSPTSGKPVKFLAVVKSLSIDTFKSLLQTASAKRLQKTDPKHLSATRDRVLGPYRSTGIDVTRSLHTKTLDEMIDLLPAKNVLGQQRCFLDQDSTHTALYEMFEQKTTLPLIQQIDTYVDSDLLTNHVQWVDLPDTSHLDELATLTRDILKKAALACVVGEAFRFYEELRSPSEKAVPVLSECRTLDRLILVATKAEHSDCQREGGAVDTGPESTTNTSSSIVDKILGHGQRKVQETISDYTRHNKDQPEIRPAAFVISSGKHTEALAEGRPEAEGDKGIIALKRYLEQKIEALHTEQLQSLNRELAETLGDLERAFGVEGLTTVLDETANSTRQVARSILQGVASIRGTTGSIDGSSRA